MDKVYIYSLYGLLKNIDNGDKNRGKNSKSDNKSDKDLNKSDKLDIKSFKHIVNNILKTLTVKEMINSYQEITSDDLIISIIKTNNFDLVKLIVELINCHDNFKGLNNDQKNNSEFNSITCHLSEFKDPLEYISCPSISVTDNPSESVTGEVLVLDLGFSSNSSMTPPCETRLVKNNSTLSNNILKSKSKFVTTQRINSLTDIDILLSNVDFTKLDNKIISCILSLFKLEREYILNKLWTLFYNSSTNRLSSFLKYFKIQIKDKDFKHHILYTHSEDEYLPATIKERKFTVITKYIKDMKQGDVLKWFKQRIRQNNEIRCMKFLDTFVENEMEINLQGRIQKILCDDLLVYNSKQILEMYGNDKEEYVVKSKYKLLNEKLNALNFALMNKKQIKTSDINHETLVNNLDSINPFDIRETIESILYFNNDYHGSYMDMFVLFNGANFNEGDESSKIKNGIAKNGIIKSDVDKSDVDKSDVDKSDVDKSDITKTKGKNTYDDNNKFSNKPIAMLIFELIQHNNTSIINSFSVDENMRNNGIGRLLLGITLLVFKRLKYKWCILDAIKKAQIFYQKFGFKYFDSYDHLPGEIKCHKCYNYALDLESINEDEILIHIIHDIPISIQRWRNSLIAGHRWANGVISDKNLKRKNNGGKSAEGNINDEVKDVNDKVKDVNDKVKLLLIDIPYNVLKNIASEINELVFISHLLSREELIDRLLPYYHSGFNVTFDPVVLNSLIDREKPSTLIDREELINKNKKIKVDKDISL